MGDETKAQLPLGGTAIKPPGWDRKGLEALKYMIYNPETGEVLSRTPLSWLKITVFYCIYYSLLAAFWVACLQIFFLTLNDGEPKWKLGESIIGTNPGVGVRPLNADKKIDSSMFYLDVRDTKTKPTDDKGEGPLNIDYATRMDLFMKKNSNASGLVDCAATPTKGKCLFDTAVLDECEKSPYGFLPANGNIQPCIFVKLNKIWNWAPKGVKVADLDSKEFSDMSESLKAKIRADGVDGEGFATHVYMDCFGRYPADKEGMELKFYPENQGIPLIYFPYSGGNYQIPMVAMKVLNKNVNQLLHIECRAWYNEVKHSTKDKAGLTQFEVFVKDEDKKEE